MRPIRPRCGLFGAIALATLLLAACAAPAAQPATDITVTAAADAEISAERRGDALIIDVHSESGIGSARIGLPPGSVPRDLIVRLHLRGLEKMTFTYDAGTIQVEVPSTGEPIVHESFQPAGDSAAQVIARGSPHWMNVGILSNDPAATPAIPLDNGHFDVSAPPNFLTSGSTDFTLSWVDFYR